MISRSHSRVAALVMAAGAGIVTFAPAGALAQEPPTTVDLLSHRAAISSEGSGYVALPLPADVLALAAPDLSDVRIASESGTLVPYAVTWRERDVDRAPPVLESFELEATSARQSQAFVLGVRVATETYEVLVPALAWREHAELELETVRVGFTATVRVTDLGGAELARGTIFSLPSISQARDTIELPARVAGPVRVEIRSEPASFGAAALPPAGPSGFLTPRIRLHQRSFEPRDPTVEQVLERVGVRSEGGAQILDLARPPGIVPTALRIETTSPTFSSTVRVEAIGIDGTRREVGRGRVLRVTPADPSAAYSELVVTVRGTEVTGDRLVVSLDRGDSPPLEGVTVIAIARQPQLVFETYLSGRSATLMFGGARLRAPRYDVAALVDGLGERAGAASLGPVVPNPDYLAEPALSFAMRAGAEVDRARFAVEAPLSIAETSEGLTRVLVSPALVAAARIDGADLRVVDATGRQWPYLPSASSRQAWVTLAVSTMEPAEGRDHTTRYVLTPSVLAISADALEVTFADAFYSRAVEVIARERPDVADEPGESVAYGTFAADAEGQPALISLLPRRARSLELFVVDGDEAPLSIASVRARLAMVDLLVTAPAGEYSVLAGDPTLRAPEYDLARADAAFLENIPALEVSVGEVRANAAYHPPSPFERAGWEAAVLYAVLGLSVLVLGLLTLRLARSEPSPAPSPSGAPAAPAAGRATPGPSGGPTPASDAEDDPADEPNDDDE